MLLLVATLPWSEPEVGRRGLLETSFNKGVVVVELHVQLPPLDLVIELAEDGEALVGKRLSVACGFWLPVAFG